MDRFLPRRQAPPPIQQPVVNVLDGGNAKATNQPPAAAPPPAPAPASEPEPEETEPSRGLKLRRNASLDLDPKGDYLDVPAYSALSRIISKWGDSKVLFADKVLKFTGSGKIKRRILLITDFAIYVVDPETNLLKRRIGLTAVVKIRLSELNDNFFAVIIPTEYDCLMASTRKTEIATVLLQATNKPPGKFVELSNRFVYRAAANVEKEIQFDSGEGIIRTRILRIEE